MNKIQMCSIGSIVTVCKTVTARVVLEWIGQKRLSNRVKALVAAAVCMMKKERARDDMPGVFLGPRGSDLEVMIGAAMMRRNRGLGGEA